MKKVFLLLAPGFELLEASAPIDVLERCGVAVEVIALESADARGNILVKDLLVPSSNSVFLKADCVLKEEDIDRIVCDGDMIILPGGYPGYENIASSKLAGRILQYYQSEGKYIAAICGAPWALGVHNIASGSRVTCHSSVAEKVSDMGYVYTGNACETCGKLITSRGAGTCLDFAFACAESLVGKDIVAEVKKKMEV